MPRHPITRARIFSLRDLVLYIAIQFYVFVDIFVPLCLPTFIKHYLFPPPSQALSESPLCSLCQNVLERNKIDTSEFSPWASYRHIDDVDVLKRTANAGCQICIKLLIWINSIEKGPDWCESVGIHVPWGFTIRSHLLRDTSSGQLEVAFTINRFKTLRDAAMDVIIFKIIPAEKLRESKGKPLVEEGTLRIESLVSMKEWVQNCTTRHTRCQRQDYNQRPTWRPTRLIFVGKDNSTPLQLCKGSSLSPDVKYMTLSHRWPEESIFKLLMGNLEALEQSVPVGSLPKNFCDAILLTRFLDVEYLWIDSLCIIQDSKDDWAIEAANMSDVYAHSFCNIAGTASQNAAQGLFVSRDPKALQLIEIKIAQNSRANRGLPNGSYYCLENIWENEVVRAPLLKRGWVFQERYLSPRIVYFGARQLFWECQELEACEMFSAGVPAVFATNYKKNSPFQNAELSGQGASLSEKPLSQDAALLTVWCDIVSIYTGCDLTFEIDKLVALSGIAARIRQMHDSKYLAGIWERGLPWHLLWMVDNSPVTITTKRIDQAPSWSWASINGKVKYVDRKGHGKSCVKILDTDTTLVGNQQFGRVSRGSIRLCGLLSAVEFKADDATLNKIDHTSHTLILYSQTPSKNLELNFGLFPDISLEICLLASLTILEELGSRRFFLLFATSGAGYVMGLILQHTGVSGQYRRLGFFLSDPGVPQVNQTVLVEAHRPKLEPAHYEEYREEDGHSTITII